MSGTTRQGRTLDDLQLGDRFEAGLRLVSRGDIAAFAELSGDRTALHMDDAYAATTPFEGIVAHGALVVSIATGLTHATGAFEGTILAVRSLSARFERPVRPGDALTLGLEVIALRPDPRGGRGVARLGASLLNQAGHRVFTGTWEFVLRRRKECPRQ